jgi:hypothetical protein
MKRWVRTPVRLRGVLVSLGPWLSVPAIPLRAPSCASGGPDRGMLLEAHHRLLERRCGGTVRPFADIRQRGSAPLLPPKPLP